MNINRQDQDYLKTLTVLYVEDDRDTREQFSEFLSRPVGRLITAVDGAEGLDAFKQYSPDIVVTDILMPRMDGLTMAYEIRGISPSVPIIVITAFEHTDYLMRAINIGVHKYVTKPVNSYLMFECLLESAHRLRAEEQLKHLHQREIDAVRAKNHETALLLAGAMADDCDNLLQTLMGHISSAKNILKQGSAALDHLEQAEKCAADSLSLGQWFKMLCFAENDTRFKQGSVMPLIQSVIEDSLTGSSVVFSSDTPEEIPAINFIEEQMRLVFSTLAANAVETMPSGGTLHLSAEIAVIAENDLLPLVPGDYLNISLSDNSSGIPAEAISKIFDPAFSPDQICVQNPSALNLALCRTIIMNHGGIIMVESKPESVLLFHIWLPAVV